MDILGLSSRFAATDRRQRSPASTCCGTIICGLRDPWTGSLSHSARKTVRPAAKGSCAAFLSSSWRVRAGSSGAVHFTSPMRRASPDALSATTSISRGWRSRPGPHQRPAGPQVLPKVSSAGTLARASSSRPPRRGVESWLPRLSRRRRSAGPPAESDRAGRSETRNAGRDRRSGKGCACCFAPRCRRASPAPRDPSRSAAPRVATGRWPASPGEPRSPKPGGSLDRSSELCSRNIM